MEFSLAGKLNKWLRRLLFRSSPDYPVSNCLQTCDSFHAILLHLKPDGPNDSSVIK